MSIEYSYVNEFSDFYEGSLNDMVAVSIYNKSIIGMIFFNKDNGIYILEIIFEGVAGSLEERLFLIETIGDIQEKYDVEEIVFLEENIRFVNLLPFYKQRRVKVLNSSSRLNNYKILRFRDSDKQEIERWINYLKNEIDDKDESVSLSLLISSAKKII